MDQELKSTLFLSLGLVTIGLGFVILIYGENQTEEWKNGPYSILGLLSPVMLFGGCFAIVFGVPANDDYLKQYRMEDFQ
jgi:hypothetical protein